MESSNLRCDHTISLSLTPWHSWVDQSLSLSQVSPPLATLSQGGKPQSQSQSHSLKAVTQSLSTCNFSLTQGSYIIFCRSVVLLIRCFVVLLNLLFQLSFGLLNFSPLMERP